MHFMPPPPPPKKKKKTKKEKEKCSWKIPIKSMNIKKKTKQ